jgi:hypothetical protein
VRNGEATTNLKSGVTIDAAAIRQEFELAGNGVKASHFAAVSNGVESEVQQRLALARERLRSYQPRQPLELEPQVNGANGDDNENENMLYRASVDTLLSLQQEIERVSSGFAQTLREVCDQFHQQLACLNEELANQNARLAQTQADVASLQVTRSQLEERLQTSESEKERWQVAYDQLAADTARRNNQAPNEVTKATIPATQAEPESQPQPASLARTFGDALINFTKKEPEQARVLLPRLLIACSQELQLRFELVMGRHHRYQVTVGGKQPGVVALPQTERSAQRSAFQLYAKPLALAHLLAGRRRIRRFGRLSARRSLRRARQFERSLKIPASLTELMRDGSDLDPALVQHVLSTIKPELDD